MDPQEYNQNLKDDVVMGIGMCQDVGFVRGFDNE
jgi:hypothetical protein